jgi:hypothetical protein
LKKLLVDEVKGHLAIKTASWCNNQLTKSLGTNKRRKTLNILLLNIFLRSTILGPYSKHSIFGGLMIRNNKLERFVTGRLF